jgi:malate dehydrogenase (oxaloacetate-decarboxylating)
MVDRFGLVSQGMDGLLDFQEALAQPTKSDWQCSGLGYPSLLDVVSNVDVGVLIGVSGKPGLFTEDVIRQLHRRCVQPIVLPLSNPSRHVEARPEQILQWTDGQAIVATGSPFAPVEYNGERYEISQCNNSYIFPGIGLGVVASKARRVRAGMLMAASRWLAEASSAHHERRNVVLPALTALAELSKAIAFAVAKVAQAEGLANERSDDELRGDIERNFWTPQYREYRRIAARAR